MKRKESDKDSITKQINRQAKQMFKTRKLSVEKENRKLVIPFLYVETMGVNGMDPPETIHSNVESVFMNRN